MNTLRTLVYELFSETFYGKWKKLTNFEDNFFYNSHESDIKNFLKWPISKQLNLKDKIWLQSWL